MNLTLTDVYIGFLLAIGGLLFWQNFKAREMALSHVKRYCQQLDIQMLDDSIYGSYWRPVFYNGQFRIKRRYRFSFTTTGIARYEGEIEMRGTQQTHIQLEAHHF